MKKIFQAIKKDNKGITLMEMLVAIAIFSVTIVSVTQIFILVLDGQQNALAARNIQENMRYAFEIMSKELRMARINTSTYLDPNVCPDMSVGRVYDNGQFADTSAGLLRVRNYHDECVKYYLEDGRIKVDRDGVSAFLTPNEIRVNRLEFVVKDGHTGGHPSIDGNQSLVITNMDIETQGTKVKHHQTMKIQTAISSRYY
ncbi:MAG: prepilin-type N-terminal cleavage/methylation domain-containing protein [Candidatus Falkowbacteria bacterium]|nr:prepilin-type N-terminal cleavage/methylation domain-containing protein [Candidatus Falkowbacteria bacterium]